VADITYINTIRDGCCYLAFVLDLHSKKVVGYSFSQSMTTDIVIKPLENAYETQVPEEVLILHTNLDSQYTRKSLRNSYNQNTFSSHSVVKVAHMIMLELNPFMPF
jgi:transposase InsO family protein